MRVVVAVADLMARTRIEGAARAAGLEPVMRSSVPGPDEDPPSLLVADLDQPGALDKIEALRAVHPDVAVTGFAFHVNADVLARAKALGVRVFAHGADPKQFFGNLPAGGGL